MVIALVLMTGFATASQPALDGPGFVRAINGLQDGVENIILVIEGGFDFVGPEKLIAPRKKIPTDRYQGTYAYRKDGSSLLETYRHSSLRPDSPLSIERLATLRGQLQSQTLSPDRRRANEDIRNSHGDPAALDMTGSASRILLLWYLQRLSAQSPPAISEQAWEEVDGHQCLRVRIDRYPRIVQRKKPTERMWIDMERGGNPLKIEWLADEKVEMRTRDIKLERFPIQEGGHAWIPVAGIAESFVWGSDYYETPIIRETYGVVRGTVKINKGLSDRAFRLETASEFTGSPYLAKARQEFSGEVKRMAQVPDEDITPASIQARLDRELAEADRQSAMLDASAPGSSTWGWPLILQVSLGGLGLLALVVVVWARKTR